MLSFWLSQNDLAEFDLAHCVLRTQKPSAACTACRQLCADAPWTEERRAVLPLSSVHSSSSEKHRSVDDDVIKVDGVKPNFWTSSCWSKRCTYSRILLPVISTWQPPRPQRQVHYCIGYTYLTQYILYRNRFCNSVTAIIFAWCRLLSVFVALRACVCNKIRVDWAAWQLALAKWAGWCVDQVGRTSNVEGGSGTE